jgi:hypothetical protein
MKEAIVANIMEIKRMMGVFTLKWEFCGSVQTMQINQRIFIIKEQATVL